MKGLDDFEGLEQGEVAYVIELLAAMSTVEEIKKRFFEFTFPGKSITVKTIQKISLRFAKQIRERNQIYLKNIEGNPLAHQRIRLDILQRIIDDCLKQRPSHSIKVADDQYEVVTKADNAVAINAIKLVMMDLAKKEEIEILKNKLNMNQKDEPTEFEVNDGIA